MLLDEDAVRRLLRMEELIPAMERALADLSAGQVVQPVRLMLPVAEHNGFFLTMPACTEEALGAKLVTFYPGNQGIPTHHALILLFHPETGERRCRRSRRNALPGRMPRCWRSWGPGFRQEATWRRSGWCASFGSGSGAHDTRGHSPSDSACARPARRQRRFAAPTQSSWPPAPGCRCSGGSGCRPGRT
jgi:Ornithine cyclodeaminase/mu-crystallin family